MGQVLFVVWRESVEALLIIGILHAWLSQSSVRGSGKSWLWGGVAIGLLVAVLLAVGLFQIGHLLVDYQDAFQTVMVLLAAGLIVHMVRWMRLNGRTLKQDLESGLSKQAAQGQWWGVALLAAIAVAREGSETVVFLYGTLSAADSVSLIPISVAALSGFALAMLTFYLLQLGGKILSWRLFFSVTEIMLLFLASALWVSGIERLISMDILPALIDPVWDSSRWLDDTTATGGVIAALTGYRAYPALTSLLAYALFWIAIWHWVYRYARNR